MTADQHQQTVSSQMQRIGADISARLAQLAKDPPDLAAYLRLHSDCIVQVLQPVGLAYEMANGKGFQRAFTLNYESLQLRGAPAQDFAFQRAVQSAAERGRTVFLDAHSAPPDALRGLAIEDAPAPENLPPHNQTPYQHAFAPIPVSKKAVGVLHAWFRPADTATAQARVALLTHAASEVELYLRARRTSDISQELTRVTTYANFLEDVAGDQDLESVSWKLVNYAREAIGCDRVCLLVDSRYGLSHAVYGEAAHKFTLQACSGLRRPHPHSEHAEVLKDHASELLKLSNNGPAASTPASSPKNAAAEKVDASKSSSEGKSSETATGDSAPERQTNDGRPQMRIVFTHRDPSKAATRPEAVNRYFEVVPMNWSTVLPLYDRQNLVCGILLFEGQQTDEKTAALFHQMRDLAVSGGRALSTALVWERRKTLRTARVLMKWRDQLLATSRRRILVRYVIPIALAGGLLAFPFPYRVAGDASMRPARVQTVTALTTGRLMEINAREGDRVTKGQILCVLDRSDLELQLRQAEQERERALTEASLALHQERSETRMQIARLTAEKAGTLAAKLRRDIEQSVIRAPFDGILIGPQDFTQRRGQMIRMGETVAEVADPSQWEAKVSVREQDVPTLVRRVRELRAENATAGVPGELKLSANPNHVYPLLLTDADSFSNRLDTSGGKYSFSTVIPMKEKFDEMNGSAGIEIKNGYTGRVKFSCGRRPLISILFGDFVRFLKVNLL